MFRGMFASDMREGREGVVKVEEVDPIVFKEMLKFIYTGRFVFLPTTEFNFTINFIYIVLICLYLFIFF